MSNNALINLGELSKPATVLIEKISDAIGGIFKPYQIIRVAKAEVEADRIRAESQIQITDLHWRAVHRFLEEEAKKQANIEDITRQALPLLEEKSSPEKVEDDWIASFFDKCRNVSDADMQRLWAKVLAGEANRPGTFSRKTVNLITDLDRRDAEYFATLCRFVWLIGMMPVPLIFDTEAAFYQKNGINFNLLSRLGSLGLIFFDNFLGYQVRELPKRPAVSYHDRLLGLTLPNDAHNELQTGKVLFTQAGKELVPLCDSKPIEGFFEFVYEKWMGDSYSPIEVVQQALNPTEGQADKVNRW